MRKSIRENVTIKNLLDNERGWNEAILYDADFATKQQYLDIDKVKKQSLYFIYKINTEVKKQNPDS